LATQLVNYIQQDLQRRIERGERVPERLTLAALSQEYGVSVTPVRTALSHLIAAGLVRKSTKGRLSVNEDRVGTGSTTEAVDTPPTPDDWDRALLQEVMLASLGREATYLREEALARRHGVGRSIIRQALTRMAGSGLVEHVPRRGWLVHPLREEDLAAYLEVRELLEIKALALARPRLERSDLLRMLEANPRPKRGQPPTLNNEFHQYLIEKSGNRYIREFFGQYIARYYTALFDYATPEASVVAEQAARHRCILEALLGRAWAQARKELSAHIWSQADVLRALLGRGE